LNLGKLNDWLQVLGLFSVLGGLIFVGLQLRLDRQVALIESANTATSNYQTWAELVNDNADVWVKGLAGDSLTAGELARFNTMASAREMSYFNDYSRSQQGVSSQIPERFVFEAAREIHANPGFLTWWREDRRRMAEVQERFGLPSSRWGAAVTEEIRRFDSEGRAH